MPPRPIASLPGDRTLEEDQNWQAPLSGTPTAFPFDVASLRWTDEEKTANEDGRYCYCGTDKMSQDAPMLRCTECRMLFHPPCVTGHSTLYGDVFYAFTCSVCNFKKPESERPTNLNNWDRHELILPYMVYLVLYDLYARSSLPRPPAPDTLVVHQTVTTHSAWTDTDADTDAGSDKPRPVQTGPTGDGGPAGISEAPLANTGGPRGRRHFLFREEILAGMNRHWTYMTYGSAKRELSQGSVSPIVTSLYPCVFEKGPEVVLGGGAPYYWGLRLPIHPPGDVVLLRGDTNRTALRRHDVLEGPGAIYEPRAPPAKVRRPVKPKPNFEYEEENRNDAVDASATIASVPEAGGKSRTNKRQKVLAADTDSRDPQNAGAPSILSQKSGVDDGSDSELSEHSFPDTSEEEISCVNADSPLPRHRKGQTKGKAVASSLPAKPTRASRTAATVARGHRRDSAEDFDQSLVVGQSQRASRASRAPHADADMEDEALPAPVTVDQHGVGPVKKKGRARGATKRTAPEIATETTVPDEGHTALNVVEGPIDGPRGDSVERKSAQVEARSEHIAMEPNDVEMVEARAEPYPSTEIIGADETVGVSAGTADGHRGGKSRGFRSNGRGQGRGRGKGSGRGKGLDVGQDLLGEAATEMEEGGSAPELIQTAGSEQDVPRDEDVPESDNGRNRGAGTRGRGNRRGRGSRRRGIDDDYDSRASEDNVEPHGDSLPPVAASVSQSVADTDGTRVGPPQPVSSGREPTPERAVKRRRTSHANGIGIEVPEEKAPLDPAATGTLHSRSLVEHATGESLVEHHLDLQGRPKSEVPEDDTAVIQDVPVLKTETEVVGSGTLPDGEADVHPMPLSGSQHHSMGQTNRGRSASESVATMCEVPTRGVGRGNRRGRGAGGGRRRELSQPLPSDRHDSTPDGLLPGSNQSGRAPAFLQVPYDAFQKPPPVTPPLVTIGSAGDGTATDGVPTESANMRREGSSEMGFTMNLLGNELDASSADVTPYETMAERIKKKPGRRPRSKYLDDPLAPPKSGVSSIRITRTIIPDDPDDAGKGRRRPRKPREIITIEYSEESGSEKEATTGKAQKDLNAENGNVEPQKAEIVEQVKPVEDGTAGPVAMDIDVETEPEVLHAVDVLEPGAPILFKHRLLGYRVREQPRISLFTGRVLKPYIYRDVESVPKRVEILEQVVEKAGARPRRRNPLDFVHLQEKWVRQCNWLLAKVFWDGIDITENLQYPDFSIVCLYGDLVVGCGCMNPQGYITYIGVLPGWEKSGIARFMLWWLITTIAPHDVSLHVQTTNPAMLLYQELGFKAEEFIVAFYDKYVPARQGFTGENNAYFMRRRAV